MLTCAAPGGVDPQNAHVQSSFSEKDKGDRI